MKITGIAHNAINVLDMDKALDFYCSAVWQTPIYRLVCRTGYLDKTR